jgi:chromate transporter
MPRWFETFWVALRLGCSSFGGPIAHIGYFQRSYVEQRQWLTQQEFAEYLAMCQALPGPASSQLGFVIGCHHGGWWGGLGAWLGFTLPSALLLLVAAVLLPDTDHHGITSLIQGLKLVAVAVVAHALFGMAPKLCTTTYRRLIAGLAMGLALLWGGWLSQIGVIVIGALMGLLGGSASPSPATPSLQPKPLSWPRRRVWLVGVLLALLVTALLSPQWRAFCALFARAGGLVFGGGHVVLPLLHEALVPSGWLSNQSFLAGYGLAQAVPGPLFTLATYLGALSAPSGALWWGALAATVMLFAPGLILAAAGLGTWQTLRTQYWFRPALDGINAAVVGILAAAWLNPVLSTAIHQASDLLVVLLGFGLLVSPWGTPLRALLLILSLTLLRAIAFT